MKYRLKKYEKETIILCNEAENTANIYTYNTALKYRLAKFSLENPNCAKLTTQYPCGAVSYEVDKKRLSIRFTSHKTRYAGNTHRSIISFQTSIEDTM